LKEKLKYRIAIVANATWNIYNFRLNVVDFFLAKGFDVCVVAPIDKYIFYKEDFPEVRHFSIKNLDRDGTNPIREFILTRELVRIYRKIKPDIVLHYTVKPNIYGGIAAGFLSIPSIGVVTGLGYAFLHKGFIQDITKILYRFSSRYHSKVIFENAEDKDFFIEKKTISVDKGISVKGCGVDIDYFSPVKKKKDNSKIIFTFIGRLLYDKGVMEFVKAAKIIKEKYDNVEFWLIGEIDKDNRAMVKEEDLMNWVKYKTVIYHGFKENVKKYIGKSDCIVLPSYREGLSRILTEAIAMEKPIIASDVPGCRETIDEGKNGYLVPVKEIEPLAGAMEKIITMSAEKREKMGKLGRKKAIREFDDNIIAENIYDIVIDILKK
jgi:glycosyltransferase involved in cell wall biosynthesis